MTVFVLFSGQYDVSTDGIFSTRELAEAARVEMEKIHRMVEVRAFEIDALIGLKAVPYWIAAVDTRTEKLLDVQYYSGLRYACPQDMDISAANDISDIPFAGTGYIPHNIQMHSLKSQEDADELAMGAMHQLREKIDFSKIIKDENGSWHYPQDLIKELYEK